jgi:hypothetical protein
MNVYQEDTEDRYHMRIELFFKTSSQLSTILNFLNTQSQIQPLYCQSFNLANKIRNENLMPYALQIIEKFPSADVCIHYSIKNNKFKTVDDSSKHFIDTVDKAKHAGVKEILLVSGSGEKRVINSLSILQYLSRQGYVPSIRIGVAFNPYMFSNDEMKMEMDRLKEKLSSNLVSVVYLQFGTELMLLQQSLHFIRDEILPKYPTIQIIGSIFLPTKQLLNRMKFRPWKGLYLSPEFLDSVDEADKILRSIVEVYKDFNVYPIIETAITTEKDVNYIKSLLDI